MCVEAKSITLDGMSRKRHEGSSKMRHPGQGSNREPGAIGAAIMESGRVLLLILIRMCPAATKGKAALPAP